jgi:hypothetical protein
MMNQVYGSERREMMNQVHGSERQEMMNQVCGSVRREIGYTRGNVGNKKRNEEP